MPEAATRKTLASQRFHAAQWLIVVLLAFIAGILWTRPPGELVAGALAQQPPLVGARGVYAFTGQLDHNRYGLFMLDIEQGTIWCYEIDNVGGVRKLRLTAARSWVYDRYLKNFNCADPSPGEVQELIAVEREARPSTAGGTAATAERDSQPATNEDSPDGR